MPSTTSPITIFSYFYGTYFPSNQVPSFLAQKISTDPLIDEKIQKAFCNNYYKANTYLTDLSILTFFCVSSSYFLFSKKYHLFAVVSLAVAAINGMWIYYSRKENSSKAFAQKAWEAINQDNEELAIYFLEKGVNPTTALYSIKKVDLTAIAQITSQQQEESTVSTIASLALEKGLVAVIRYLDTIGFTYPITIGGSLKENKQAMLIHYIELLIEDIASFKQLMRQKQLISSSFSHQEPKTEIPVKNKMQPVMIGKQISFYTTSSPDEMLCKQIKKRFSLINYLIQPSQGVLSLSFPLGSREKATGFLFPLRNIDTQFEQVFSGRFNDEERNSIKTTLDLLLNTLTSFAANQ